MKRIRINNGRIGLVFRNDDLVRVLQEGMHWVRLSDFVRICDLYQPLPISLEIDTLLSNNAFNAAVELVEVQDGHIALVFEYGNLRGILSPGRYGYWKAQDKYSFRLIDLELEIPSDLTIRTLSHSKLSVYQHVFRVDAHERGVLVKDNENVVVLEPGEYRFWRNGHTMVLKTVDMRSKLLEVSGQELLTRDKAAVRMNFDVQYRITDVLKAVMENHAFERQLYIQVQLALRAFVGGRTLDEILESKDTISKEVQQALSQASPELGIEVTGCGLRDIILPGDMKAIMNEVLIAQKQAQANVITRREETASTRSLLNTAKLMEENKMLFKLKEMEYVEKIADKIAELKIGNNGHVIDQLKTLFSTGK